MASITQTARGWRAFVLYDGKRYTKSFRTQREAKAWAAAREVELREQKNADPAELHKVRDLLTRYIEDVSPSKETSHGETLRLRAFIRDYPELADLKLSEFKTPHLVEWRDKRLKQIKAASFLRELTPFRHAFRIGRLEWHWLSHDPFEGLSLPEEGPPRDRRIDPWKEVRPIVRALGYVTGREPVTKSQEVALAWLIALRSAMRAGEILQMGKETLDMQKRVARVKHKMQYITGKPRSIPLTRQAVRLLSVVAHREQCFTVDSASMDALFRKAYKQRKILGLQFRDSRAEALTRLARKVDVLTLSKISGHADLRMLSQVYYRETAEQIAARI